MPPPSSKVYKYNKNGGNYIPTAFKFTYRSESFVIDPVGIAYLGLQSGNVTCPLAYVG